MELQNKDRDTCITEVERRDTVLGKLRGLMFQNKGRILMVFNREKHAAVWMPFVPRALDIGFITADNTLCHTVTAEPLTWRPGTWQLYRSPVPCRYVIEVEAGLFAEKHWEPGDTLTGL